MSEDVFLDDLLREMERLDSATPDGFTSWEMAKHLGHSQAWARKKIRELIDLERAEYVGVKKVERSDKKLTQVPVYRILAEHGA